MAPNPQSATSPSQTQGGHAGELDALLLDAGVSRLPPIGWIRVTGEDRARWLNGMVTNSVQHLASNQGAYSFFLNAQGRIQGDGTIFAEDDALWIETARPQVAGMMTMLDRFIIMDDVKLADESGEWPGLLIAGPQAPALLKKIGIEAVGTNALAMHSALWNKAEVRIVQAHSPLVPRFEVWIREGERRVATAITDALLSEGAVLCTAESLEWLRLLEGTPLYGVDIRDRELPQETGQERALHFAKGCYLGQEIVERIRSRGSVHRTFHGFRLEGELPAAGANLEADGKLVGELTSAAAVPLSRLLTTSFSDRGAGLQLALGYVRREAVERGLPLVYQGGVATPITLPIQLALPAAAALHQSPASESTERV